MGYKNNTGIGYSHAKKPTLPQVPIKKQTCANCSDLAKQINNLANTIKHLQQEIKNLESKIDKIIKT